jgi:exodeoxyribonuclease-1
MQTSSTHTFLWHDYETFGLNTRRDRPAQFAGIRTDADLNEVGEPIELYCQPHADYLPDPTSCLLTGITPQRCQERGIPEPEFARRIEAALGSQSTIGVGYNTIRFDDEVTRNLFWRNLIDPYSREWRNQCGRWDVQDLVRATYALRPDGINWPVDADGKPRFKLEMLTKANGIAHEAAHDAVSDVRATIALARLIKTLQPKLFDFYLALHKKDRVMQEMNLPATQMFAKPFIHVSGMFPAERGCMAVMWPLATHPTNKNEIIAWDLCAGTSGSPSDLPSILMDLKAEQIRERMFTKQDDLPEGENGKVKRLPIKTVHLNKSPFVLGNLKTLTPALQEKWGIDLEECLGKAQLARNLPDMSAVWSEVFKRPSAANNDTPPDVDEALYDGFINDADRRTLAQLHKQAMTTPQTLGSRIPAFDDPRLDEVFWRYRARNFPQILAAEEQTAWTAQCRSRLVDGAGKARTLTRYFEEIKKLEDGLQATLNGSSEPNVTGKAILERLREYGAGLLASVS